MGLHIITIEMHPEFRLLVEIHGFRGRIPPALDARLQKRFYALGFVSHIDPLPEDNAYILSCDYNFDREEEIREAVRRCVGKLEGAADP